MTKFQMLYTIAKDCIDDEYKAKHFAYRAKGHKTVEEVKTLYHEWESGEKSKEYFKMEIIGYTETKKRVYINNHSAK